jgi:glycine cleavage system aminomethyltransferase T
VLPLRPKAFPFRASRAITVGYARVLCNRITYVGELGYELCIPTENAAHVYERIVAAGADGSDVTVTHCGLKSLGSLRMEKAYRDYGHDMDNTDTLLEMGLGFTCAFGKQGAAGLPDGFLGEQAVLAQKAGGVKALRKRLVQVLLQDPEPLLYHGEILYRDGVCMGDVRGGSYGHTLGGAVGLALVETHDAAVTLNKKFMSEGQWEVDIGGTRHAVTVSLAPMYDPKNARIKA